jgi:YVTN family beta-propeller protein
MSGTPTTVCFARSRALGLGTLTPNDRYAQPVNDVFGRQPAPPAPATVLPAALPTRARAPAAARRAAVSPGAAAARHPTAFVVNSASASVTPVDLATRRAGPPIPAGVYNYPTAITLAPGGGTAVVVGSYAGKVTLIDTRTRHALAQVKVGAYPVAAAIAG